MSTQNVAMIDRCFWSISFLHAGEVTLSGRLLATASICQGMSSAAAALSGSDCVERCIRLVFLFFFGHAVA